MVGLEWFALPGVVNRGLGAAFFLVRCCMTSALVLFGLRRLEESSCSASVEDNSVSFRPYVHHSSVIYVQIHESIAVHGWKVTNQLCDYIISHLTQSHGPIGFRTGFALARSPLSPALAALVHALRSSQNDKSYRERILVDCHCTDVCKGAYADSSISHCSDPAPLGIF